MKFKAMIELSIPVIIGVKSKTPPKKIGNLPMNSPKKISPVVAGDAKIISLKPISTLL